MFILAACFFGFMCIQVAEDNGTPTLGYVALCSALMIGMMLQIAHDIGKERKKDD